MKLSLSPKCTCAAKVGHFFGCDLMYESNSFPRKKKRFFFFYPMKRISYQSYYNRSIIMNLKLTVIILSAVIVGMIITVPTIFLSDIIIGGIMFGALAALIGYFALRHGSESKSEA
jgi:hypothetical protein